MKPNLPNIRLYNRQQFINDMREAKTIMTFASSTGKFFKITKQELYLQAEAAEIRYMMTRKIFKNERLVLVIL